eukprot:scaffold129769_cov30-Tisochrysis_lutea.AAC.1
MILFQLSTSVPQYPWWSNIYLLIQLQYRLVEGMQAAYSKGKFKAKPFKRMTTVLYGWLILLPGDSLLQAELEHLLGVNTTQCNKKEQHEPTLFAIV